MIFMHAISKYPHLLCGSLLVINCLARPISFYGMGMYNLHDVPKNIDSRSEINVVREVSTRSGFRYIYVYIPTISTDENEIKKLAAMLNNKFTKYKKVKAIIFDNLALARVWAFGPFDDVTDLEIDARVLYFLNRTTSEEYVQYSSEKGKSVLERKIVISEKKR